ncbi:hypothetical protein C8F01DRAFT_1303855 [Mycena amicta]|nr:hypothetical protein C8F01DRAFT_1303855 [Mycena amicta]
MSGKYDGRKDDSPRDTPTCDDFLSNTPMQQTMVVHRHHRALNRKGRAIARIVRAHGWCPLAIARIFRVSETTICRCVQPGQIELYYPEDLQGDDYEYAGGEFREQFPPVRRQDNSIVELESDSEEDQPGPNARRRARTKSKFTTPKKAIVTKMPRRTRPVKKSPYNTAKSAPPAEVRALDYPSSEITPGQLRRLRSPSTNATFKLLAAATPKSRGHPL